MRRGNSAERLALGLGWFSIGLGLAELLAPKAIAKLSGGEGRNTGLIRLYGAREIMSGLLIFSQGRKPAGGVWSRVAGDVIDLATLAAAAANPKTNKAGIAFATANVLGVTALDVMCARQLSEQKGQGTGGTVRTTRSIMINRPQEELYQFWRNVENLPRFMFHLQSVRATGPGTSHWVVNAPGGGKVEWDSEVTEDVPNQRLSWRSRGGTAVPNSGTVRFERATGNRGTIVTVEMEYSPPGGVLGSTLAMLFNESPEQQVSDDLRRLKQVIETGEVVRSDGSPRGTGQIRQRPARPMESPPTV